MSRLASPKVGELAGFTKCNAKFDRALASTTNIVVVSIPSAELAS